MCGNRDHRVREAGGGRDCWEQQSVGNAVAKMQVQGILANTVDMNSWVMVAVGTSVSNPRDLKYLSLIMC